MTCFSIQKSLISAVLTAFLCAAPLCVYAQTSDLETQDKQSAEQRIKAEKDKKEKEEAAGHVNSPIVLELFTTSDCTACIYADRMLYDAMKDKSVIALSCHIKDLSEMKKKSQKEGRGDDSSYDGPMDPCVFRLWSYNSSRITEDITVTIPNFMFNGYDYVNGTSLTYFQTMLNTYHYAYKNKVLDVFMQWKDDDTITVNLPQDPKYEKVKVNASVWIVRYKDMAVERIDEGVNKGRVLRFSNIIQDIRHIAKWHGQMRSINVDVPKPQGGKDRGGFVIIVSQLMGEPILAAGKLEDYPHPNDRKKGVEEKSAAKPSPERSPAPAAAPSAAAAGQPPAVKAPGTSYITP